MSDAEAKPQEAQAGDGARSFQVGDESWVARVAGTGLGGTGHLASARFVGVQFFRAGEAEPSFEALLPVGRFELLFDSELAQLLATARPIAR